MTVPEICALPVRNLAAPNCHLYLWTTNTHLEHAWDVARAWGFVPKQLLTWCKRPKGMIGFGAFSPCTEFVLFGSNASRAIHLSRCERTWFEWPRSTKHSEKPQGFFDIIERISPAPRLEMFARRLRIGWESWGNEIASTVEIANA